MIEKGLKHQSVMVVNEGNTAEFIGSGDMAVLATPAMVALMENAAMMAVALHLDEGDTLIGEGDHIRYIVNREKFLSKL
jgi:predicted thioesterase